MTDDRTYLEAIYYVTTYCGEEIDNPELHKVLKFDYYAYIIVIVPTVIIIGCLSLCEGGGGGCGDCGSCGNCGSCGYFGNCGGCQNCLGFNGIDFGNCSGCDSCGDCLCGSSGGFENPGGSFWIWTWNSGETCSYGGGTGQTKKQKRKRLPREFELQMPTPCYVTKPQPHSAVSIIITKNKLQVPTPSVLPKPVTEEK